MSDRLYFKQLLAGRDFATTDPIARQMVNFVYLIGDTETREAVVVDPAYDVTGLLDILDADGMNLIGALATHYHPDHVGGSMMGHTISGVRELLMKKQVPIHVQADEADGVTFMTGATDDLVTHASSDIVSVGAIDIELIHTPGHTPGSQCFLVDNKLDRRRHVVPRGLRAHRPARWRPVGAVREHQHQAVQGPRRRHPVPRPPLLGRTERDDGRDPQVELRVQARDRAAVARHVRSLNPDQARTTLPGRAPVGSPFSKVTSPVWTVAT